jgi:SHS2 domain-containing protein
MRNFIVSDRFTTADIGLDLEADSPGELFIAGAEGLFTLIFGSASTGIAARSREIDLETETPEQLLVDWLSELLYLFDAEGLIACDYDIAVVLETGSCRLGGTAGFRAFDAETDIAEHEVKAVTYYKLKIEGEGGIYRTHVVFDL